MSTLVVGDLHLKQPFVLPQLDALLATRGDVDRVVFLGDACDDWGARPYQAREALECYATWVERHRTEGMRVDVLLGNHDFCYLRGKRGPGTIAALMREIRPLLENRLHVQVACTIGPRLCTHAGITRAWAKRYLSGIASPISSAFATAAVERGAEKGNNAIRPGQKTGVGACRVNNATSAASPHASDAFANAIAEHLNDMLAEPDCWSALDSCPPSRGGWQLPGPLWADLRDLADDPFPGLSGFVGHTPVETAHEPWIYAPDSPHTSVWACDTLSLTSTGTPIGDGSMLLVDANDQISPLPFPGGTQGFHACVNDYLANCR